VDGDSRFGHAPRKMVRDAQRSQTAEPTGEDTGTVGSMVLIIGIGTNNGIANLLP
jgi:hypothetical protein